MLCTQRVGLLMKQGSHLDACSWRADEKGVEVGAFAGQCGGLSGACHEWYERPGSP